MQRPGCACLGRQADSRRARRADASSSSARRDGRSAASANRSAGPRSAQRAAWHAAAAGRRPALVSRMRPAGSATTTGCSDSRTWRLTCSSWSCAISIRTERNCSTTSVTRLADQPGRGEIGRRPTARRCPRPAGATARTSGAATARTGRCRPRPACAGRRPRSRCGPAPAGTRSDTRRACWRPAWPGARWRPRSAGRSSGASVPSDAVAITRRARLPVQPGADLAQLAACPGPRRR